VYSDRLQVARDLFTELNTYKDKFEITSATFEPFLEKSGDVLAGYVITININILDVACATELPRILATVKNSNNTYSTTVANGGTLILPDTTYAIQLDGVFSQNVILPTLGLDNLTINLITP